MGRVIYGVAGDAGGHVSRALAIAEELRRRGHDIVFVGGGRVADLASRGYAVVPIAMFETKLSANGVRPLASGFAGLAALARSARTVARLCALIREVRPDLIVTDYEHFLPLAARRLGYPSVSVDRQHALTLCRYDMPPGQRVNRALTLSAIRLLYSAANRYLVSSFVAMQPIDPARTEVFPPVLRREVGMHSVTDGEHAVAYLRGADLRWVRSVLGGRRRRFLIYGFDIAAEEGNLSFRRRSDAGFLADLAGCAYVVCNGGHNLICEALHYRKPLLCLPIRLFYEQLVNAHLLAQAGYGACAAPAEGAVALAAFEERLPAYSAQAAAYRTWMAQSIPQRLEQLMARPAERPTSYRGYAAAPDAGRDRV